MYPQIINCVNEYLTGRKANIIFTSDAELIFDGTLERFPSNANIFLSVDKGKFMILIDENRHQLTYEIYLPNSLFVFSFVAGIVGFVLGSIWPGMLAILWLGGMNLLITNIRHKSMFDEIVSEINQSLISNKSVLANEIPPVILASDSTFLKATGLAIAIIVLLLFLII